MALGRGQLLVPSLLSGVFHSYLQMTERIHLFNTLFTQLGRQTVRAGILKFNGWQIPTGFDVWNIYLIFFIAVKRLRFLKFPAFLCPSF